MSSITPIKLAEFVLRVGNLCVGVVVLRGGNCLCTLGFEAPTLGFAVCLGASNPGLFIPAMCWNICAKTRSTAICRWPNFFTAVLGLGFDRAVTSCWAVFVAASMADMPGTLVCYGKNSSVS